MHFLEPAQFLNAPDLAGHKVNAGHKVYFTACCGSVRPAVGVLALKKLCSHLHKITNEPVFLYGDAPFYFHAVKDITWAIGRGGPF